jgi:SspJ family small acid-soluble spore protein
MSLFGIVECVTNTPKRMINKLTHEHKDKDLVNGAFEDIEQVLKKHQKWCIIQKKDNK